MAQTTMLTNAFMPYGHPIYVVAKPVGSSCNLKCKYCYFIDKATGRMSEALLERFIEQYLEAQTQAEVLFTWHGGEPLLQPITFYETALRLQQKHARGRHIDNCLQTNGTLLTDEWCRFLAANGFLVGISLDGPEPMHNHNRQQFAQTMRGVGLLRRHKVMWNVLATVNRRNVAEPEAFYRFFKSIGCEYLQFTPIVEQKDGRMTPESVTAAQWGDFLCRLFDLWLEEDVGKVYVQLFDTTLAAWAGQPAGLCSMSPHCGHSAALQPDGTLYSCDHFADDAHRLGNIRQQTITEMMWGRQQLAFGRQKTDGMGQNCRFCPYLFACYGECPKNRILPGGENYLCAGYRQFFAHVAPTMDAMTEELRSKGIIT